MSASADNRVVLLTSPGRGAVASLLVAGPAATELVARLFHPAGRQPLDAHPCGQIVFGRWQSPASGEEIVVCRRAPDRVELHCHGGQAAAAAIIAALVELGCRETSWQEWVRLESYDPLAAAARVALASATTERTAIILLDQLDGALARAIDQAKASLAAGDTPGASAQLDRLLDRAALGAHLTRPWKVVLAGRPNVGKSSLINALVGYERAIVHPTPGTTRDIVTAGTAFDGWPVELADTAGLRSHGEPLETAGIDQARAWLRAADLVVLVFDASAPAADDDRLAADWPEAMRVFNKCDLLPPAAGSRPPGLRTSALRGDGVDALIRAITARLVPAVPPAGAAVPFETWHAESLSAARAALAAGDAPEAARQLARFGC